MIGQHRNRTVRVRPRRCSQVVWPLATVRYGRNSLTLHAGPVNRPFGGRSTIELPFTGGQRHALASALSNHVRIIATVYGLIVTPDGSVQRQTAGRSVSIRG
jgi:hypothetical protein